MLQLLKCPGYTIVVTFAYSVIRLFSHKNLLKLSVSEILLTYIRGVIFCDDALYKLKFALHYITQSYKQGYKQTNKHNGETKMNTSRAVAVASCNNSRIYWRLKAFRSAPK